MSKKLKIICISAGSVLFLGLIAVIVVLSVQNHQLKTNLLQGEEEPSSVVTVQNSAYSGSIGSNLTWTLDPETFTLTIGGEGEMDDKYDDETRPSYYYAYHDKIREVIFTDDVTSIAPYAFESFTALRKVKLGKNLKHIGECAFESSSLEEIATNDVLETIGLCAFSGCENLEEIWLSRYYNDEEVPIADTGLDRVFINMSQNNPLYSSTDDGCLYNKDKTELVLCVISGDEDDGSDEWPDYVIPDTVTTLRECCIDNNHIRKITVPGSVKVVGDNSLFALFAKQLVFEEGVKEIGNINVYGVDEFVIPDSVTKIDEYAFDSEYDSTITFGKNSAALTTGKDGYIYTKDMKMLIQVPQKVVETQSITTTKRDRYDSYEETTFNFKLPDGVERIAASATSYLCYADYVTCTIPDSVTFIGDNNFNGLYMKDNVTLTLPKGLKEIGYYCFHNCTIHSLALPKSVEIIGGQFLEDTDNGRYDEKADEYVEKKTKLMVESQKAWLALNYEDLPDTVEVVYS